MTKDEKRQMQRQRLMGNRAYQTMQGLTRYMDRYYLDGRLDYPDASPPHP